VAEHKKHSLSCEEFATLASTRMEQGVSWSDRLRMLWHEIQCVYCRRFVTQLKRIRNLLRAEVPAAPMPPEIRTRLRQKLRTKP